MFKGLRTKIEGEQKGHNSISRNASARNDGNTSSNQTQHSNLKERDPLPIKLTGNLNKLAIQSDPKSDPKDGEVSSIDLDKQISSNDLKQPLIAESRPISSKIHSKSDYQQNLDELNQPLAESSIETLQCQINKLNEQIRIITRERDESNDQNAQLYQIIEKLRRNLETEKETNSSLTAKISQFETDLNARSHRSFSAISMKTFNPNNVDIEENPLEIKNAESMRNEIIDLQGQLLKKNRLLKVRQQNLNDIKKALQKEMMDHCKTQDELSRVQSLLKEKNETRLLGENKTESPGENGSSHQVEPSDTSRSRDFNQNISDKNQEYNLRNASSQGGEDTISLNATYSANQLDRISCLSRSTASVDDFESNDLQQTNYNKEVGHEYLRNVLFRYMTSTDRETARHLIKAISVLVNFTPEQAAAINGAINARSSWLRLK